MLTSIRNVKSYKKCVGIQCLSPLFVSFFYRGFILRISVTVSSKLVLSKQVIFAFEKIYFEKGAEISGFVVLSKFCALRRELFHPEFIWPVKVMPVKALLVSDLTDHHFMCF